MIHLPSDHAARCAAKLNRHDLDEAEFRLAASGEKVHLYSWGKPKSVCKRCLKALAKLDRAPAKPGLGDLVQYFFDTGCRGYAFVYGVVIAAGPKAFTVRWESGIVNRVQRDNDRGVKPINPNMISEVAKPILEEATRIKGAA